MIKTGICTLQELRRTGALRGFFGGARLPSISLYEEAIEAQDGLGERVLERFADARGAYKRTYRNRFEAFDAQVLPILQASLNSQAPIVLHDAGVSDGRTACDFFRKIASAFPQVQYEASDYDMAIRLVYAGKTVTAFSSAGLPLEIMAPPFVHSINRPESFLFYPLNYLHRLYALNAILPAAREKLNAMRDTKIIELWCAEARQLQKTDSRFRLMFHDLLNPFGAAERYHVIRAMNVLNANYFQPAEQAKIGQHLLRAMRDGGLLVVGKNENSDSIVNGAVYRKGRDRFAALTYLGVENPPFDTAILAARP